MSWFNARRYRFDEVAIVSVKGSDFRIHFWYMSKDDAITMIKSSNLNEKSGLLRFFLLYIKISQKTAYHEENREIILNRGNEYYKNNQVRLSEKARNKYWELSDKEKNIKREYGRNRYENTYKENNKQRLKEYQNVYGKAKK